MAGSRVTKKRGKFVKPPLTSGSSNIDIGDVDRDGGDRTITFRHTTLKTVVGVDDSSNRFTINTDATFDGTANNNSLTIDQAHAMTVAGDITAFATSDKRLKTNVQPIQDPLDKIDKIGGYTFDWIPHEKVHSKVGSDIGVIAQEIEEVLPEVTTTRENGYKAVQYEKIVPLLIESIKEQQKQIKELQGKVELLEKK